MKNHIEENYEAQRHNYEFLRAQFEQREIERARIREYCGTMHPITKTAFWLITVGSMIAVIALIVFATRYFLTK